jgi:UDP-N-acetylmuramate--alanine ligase
MSKHYHLIGIGGIGMSGIARLLLRQGIEVSGSDVKDNKIIGELIKTGARIFIGHNGDNIKGADLVIYSSAIKEDNPEIIEARRQAIPVCKRAQALAQLMRDKSVIAVTGSHGKTTTSSLVSCLLLEAGLSPTVAVGGIFKNIQTNASFGEGDFFVAEADESDGSFLYYRPKYSIITNIDREHLDYYGDFQNEMLAFREFINNTDKDGCVFCCYDDENLRKIMKDYKAGHVFFGINEKADCYPKKIEFKGLSSGFDCFYRKKSLGRFELSLGGVHNISNSLAVISLGLLMGIDIKAIASALKNYKGAGRRLEIKFQDARFTVIDDYAHHPTEIKASLLAMKNCRGKRIIAVFQPHRYSRTKLLLDEFAQSFDCADYVILTDIYAASEPPIPGISGYGLYERLKKLSPDKPAVFLPKEKILEHILNIARPDDLIITLGAGDIVKISDELAASLKK